MEYFLYLAALLLVSISLVHSYLGERYILIRLFSRGDLPALFGSTEFTRRTLRFAWHLTSIAWLGFAAILVSLATAAANTETIAIIIGLTFLMHVIIALVGSRAKHLSWPVFLAIGILAIYATQP